MSEGWIKLHRKLKEHWLYPANRSKPFTEFEAWIDLLMEVNHSEQKVRVKNRLMVCKAGQSIRSIKEWARRWGWGKSKTYRFFDLLEDDSMIETENETVTTRLSVCNWGTYQGKRNADETQMNRKRNASETTPDTNKNVKNVKNERSLFGDREKSDTGEPEQSQDLIHGKTWEQWFDLFWKYYPDRGPGRNPKQRTREYFERLVLEEDVDPKVIVTGTAVFRKAMASLNGEDRRTIPMASTFLNGAEYQDYYERYEKRRPDSPETLKKQGYLTEAEAEKYSQEKFRNLFPAQKVVSRLLNWKIRNFINLLADNEREFGRTSQSSPTSSRSRRIRTRSYVNRGGGQAVGIGPLIG